MKKLLKKKVDTITIITILGSIIVLTLFGSIFYAIKSIPQSRNINSNLKISNDLEPIQEKRISFTRNSKLSELPDGWSIYIDNLNNFSIYYPNTWEVINQGDRVSFLNKTSIPEDTCSWFNETYIQYSVRFAKLGEVSDIHKGLESNIVKLNNVQGYRYDEFPTTPMLVGPAYVIPYSDQREIVLENTELCTTEEAHSKASDDFDNIFFKSLQSEETLPIY